MTYERLRGHRRATRDGAWAGTHHHGANHEDDGSPIVSRMVTTLTLDPATRDRLKRYGHAGMTYDEILVALMDRVDADEFVLELRRRAEELDAKDAWIDLADA